jgi:hypothetical protein
MAKGAFPDGPKLPPGKPPKPVKPGKLFGGGAQLQLPLSKPGKPPKNMQQFKSGGRAGKRGC